jgi:hypothetical protein
MKVEAVVVFRLQASSLSQTGAILDEVLERARERDDIEVGQVNVVTPPGVTPVTLPPISAGREYVPGGPRPGGVNGS